MGSCFPPERCSRPTRCNIRKGLTVLVTKAEKGHAVTDPITSIAHVGDSAPFLTCCETRSPLAPFCHALVHHAQTVHGSGTRLHLTSPGGVYVLLLQVVMRAVEGFVHRGGGYCPHWTLGEISKWRAACQVGAKAVPGQRRLCRGICPAQRVCRRTAPRRGNAVAVWTPTNSNACSYPHQVAAVRVDREQVERTGSVHAIAGEDDLRSIRGIVGHTVVGLLSAAVGDLPDVGSIDVHHENPVWQYSRRVLIIVEREVLSVGRNGDVARPQQGRCEARLFGAIGVDSPQH
jgi:hypothetical protein